MKRSGQQVEKLIQEIEKHLLPEGLNVAARERVFNDEGIQIAELDIVITGALGSSSINWLIECRDRPSEGAAPVSWIEQLIGRRIRFKFEKVMAVSTTGFSDGARELAGREAIVLRTVSTITDIADDFKVQEFNFVTRNIRVVGVINLNTADPSDKRFLEMSDPKFKRVDETNYQNLQDFVLNHANLPAEIERNSTYRFVFVHRESLDLLVNNESFRIRDLQIPVELNISVFNGKALAMNVYSESNRIIGQEATFQFNTPQGSFDARALLLNRPDGEQDLKVFLPNELPPGITLDSLSLYGRM